MRNPCPRKEADRRTIYTSRALKSPGKIGPPVLCDFGSAVFGDREHSECVQPNIYRAPEVTLGASWDYKVDIWNVGCMVGAPLAEFGCITWLTRHKVWDIFKGNQLFHGINPEHHAYRRRAHLAEIVALLGPPPEDLLARSPLASTFFSNTGTFTGGIRLPDSTSLSEMETLLAGDEKTRFLEFMHKMLQWDPKQRSTARELFQDAWLQEQT